MTRDTRHHHVLRRGNDNFVQRGAFRGRAKIARGCEKRPRGCTKSPRGAKSYDSYVFLCFRMFSYDSLPLVHFPELSYASGQNARRCQTNPRDEKLNRSTQRKVCDEIRDIIMSDVAETTILCKGAHSEGARKSLEGAKNGLEGAQKVLEVKNRTIRTNSYEFVRIVRLVAFGALPRTFVRFRTKR